MSDIPFVKLLGDELERAARDASRRPSRRGRPRHARALIAVAVLLAASAAGASTLLRRASTPTELAVNAVWCHNEGRGNDGTTLVASRGRSPLRTCASIPGNTVPATRLVACYGGRLANGPYVQVFAALHPGECSRRHLKPLPASAYRAAQSRLSVLEQTLLRIQYSHDCVPIATFVREAQGALARLGWSDWRTRLQAHGWSCGSLSRGNSAGRLEAAGSLEAGSETLTVYGEPPRSLRADEQALWQLLERRSGHSCASAATLEQAARYQTARDRLEVAFAETDEPRFMGMGGGRQQRYEEGCAVMANVELTRGERLDVLMYRKGAGPAAAQGADPPEGAYRR